MSSSINSALPRHSPVPGHISRTSYKSNVGKKGECVYKNNQHLLNRADVTASKLNVEILQQNKTHNERLGKSQKRLQRKLEARQRTQERQVQRDQRNNVELNAW
jgi:hypothetical protein